MEYKKTPSSKNYPKKDSAGDRGSLGNKPSGSYHSGNGKKSDRPFKPGGEWNDKTGSTVRKEGGNDRPAFKKYDNNRPGYQSGAPRSDNGGSFERRDSGRPAFKKFDNNNTRPNFKSGGYKGGSGGSFERKDGDRPAFKKFDNNRTDFKPGAPRDGGFERKEFSSDRPKKPFTPNRSEGGFKPRESGSAGGYKSFDKPRQGGASRPPIPRNKPITQSYPDRKPVPAPVAEPTEEFAPSGAVAGRNAVKELLKSGRQVDKLFVQRGEREGSIVVLVAQAVERGIPVVEVDREKLDVLSAHAIHQGVVAMAAEKEYVGIDDILAIAKERGERPFIIIADEIMDPHNLGAIIRSAEGAGAHGVVITKRRAVGVSPTVAKASAGATEHMAIAKVANVINTIEQLKKEGIWIFAADSAGTPYSECKFDMPCAIVLGNEGEGISAAIKSKCDFTVGIPMHGKIGSLNVSSAAAIILYEASRQLYPNKHKSPDMMIE